MSPPRPIPRLLPVSLLAAVAGGLGWLLLGFARDRGERPLPGGEAALEIFAEHGRAWTLAQVLQAAPNRWRRAAQPEVLGWPNGEAQWVRVTLRNPGARPLRGVLADEDYFLDRVDAWVRNGAEWEHAASGESIPAAEKPIAGREVAFPVEVPARSETVVVVRAQDLLAGFLRLGWWPSQAEFQAMQTRRALAEGIYLGGLFALLGYNALLWLRLRLADIGYYVLYLAALAAFMVLARAHAVGLGWALSSPGLETLLALAMAASGFFLLRFARVFLELPAQPAAWPRRLGRGLELLALALALAALTTPWLRNPPWLEAAVEFSGVTHLALLAIALWAWRHGVRQARFFVAAFGCVFAGSLPAVAVWIWADAFKATAMQGLMIGSGLEMLVLSLATADRFAQAQRRAAEEAEQRRAVEEAYADELETEVHERTRELEEANADKDRMLAVIGHDLRSPLTGLMKSADQVAGDFARDTAHTGRALLLMIEDLVLWARMRAGTRDVAAHPARALLQPAVALHRALAERGGTDLVLDVPENLRVETDLVLAQTLVRNLLANALKFARTRVVLRAQDDAKGGVYFSVGNDGPPLPDGVIARLAAGQDEPMTAIGGLGLRLCREICTALGLRLEARAPAEGGAEFAFTLPVAENPPEENP